jgi:NTP pyrophosphatase (non-canonical NTP hydrolase)
MKFTREQLEVLNDVRDHVAQTATEHGFKEPPPGIPAEVWNSPALDVFRAAVYTANLHGEVSEVWEAARKGHLKEPCDKAKEMQACGLPVLTCVEEEIADVIIRALDDAAEFKVDVAGVLAVKMAFNERRAFRHGGKLA